MYNVHVAIAVLTNLELGKGEGNRNPLVRAQADILFSSSGKVWHLKGQIIVRETSSGYNPGFNHDMSVK